jgi:Site-specific recombinase XerD
MKQNWPHIRKVKDKNKREVFLVDARINGEGRRYFFPLRRDADTKAQALRTERRNQGTNMLYFPERLRVEAMECAEKLKPFGKSLRDAVNFYLPRLQIENRTCTINALVQQMLNAKKRDGASERYLGDLRSRLGQFTVSFDGKNVSDFTNVEIDQWLRSLGVSAITRNNFRRALIVAFNFARANKFCIENPARETAKAKETRLRPQILTVDQAAMLLERAGPDLVPFIALGAFAGLRRAELERLEWNEVDLESALIEIPASKAKSASERFVKIEPNLAAWLEPHAQPRGNVAPLNYRELLDAARYAAGIARWPKNALRHSFASYHLAKFNDAAALSLQLGHTSPHLVFKHYRQVVRPKEAERYWQITPAPARGKITAFAG